MANTNYYYAKYPAAHLLGTKRRKRMIGDLTRDRAVKDQLAQEGGSSHDRHDHPDSEVNINMQEMSCSHNATKPSANQDRLSEVHSAKVLIKSGRKERESG